jgi:hypothetical protein
LDSVAIVSITAWDEDLFTATLRSSSFAVLVTVAFGGRCSLGGGCGAGRFLGVSISTLTGSMDLPFGEFEVVFSFFFEASLRLRDTWRDRFFRDGRELNLSEIELLR